MEYNKLVSNREAEKIAEEKKIADLIKLEIEEKSYAVLESGKCMLELRNNCINNGEKWDYKESKKLCLNNRLQGYYGTSPSF